MYKISCLSIIDALNFENLRLQSSQGLVENVPDRGGYQNSMLANYTNLPAVVDAFLGYWKPNAVILMESELWPNVLMAASKSKSTAEAIRFQLLQAPPFIVNISADLKYCVGEIATSTNSLKGVKDFLAQLNHREVWMASSVHKGEHEGELRELYRLMPISVIGGSFLPTSSGHNIAEAMAAGSAVLTGPHVGHFSHMVSAMQSFNPLSILQVSGEAELVNSLHELLSVPIRLEARQTAAKQAFYALSCGYDSLRAFLYHAKKRGQRVGEASNTSGACKPLVTFRERSKVESIKDRRVCVKRKVPLEYDDLENIVGIDRRKKFKPSNIRGKWKRLRRKEGMDLLSMASRCG
uniref:3-deoxy-D-manno-octulosonic-acid transferase N-terminal domain-containing protein n=1 Tax=Chenopodium quinoa TaxID=63459 RepID=A0A803MQQ0_CHEQI